MESEMRGHVARMWEMKNMYTVLFILEAWLDRKLL